MTPEVLRTERVKLGLTQAQLARTLGVAPNTVARWERRQLDIRHPELIQLALDRLKSADSRGSSQAARRRSRPQNNLPRETTSFIGREQEIEAVIRRVQTTPLLTLYGPGGCGKSRLALQVARRLVGNFADGVCLVELASLNDDQLVARAVASALGVRARPGLPLLQSLAEALRTRQLLLVLDNCEHVIDPCVEVADALLQSADGLRVLATSREPLKLPGEVLWTLAPLSSPTRSRKTLTPVDLERFEATRLFVERVLDRLPQFVPSPADSAAIAAICQRLDGMPLAIELAAARVIVMGCSQLASRLDHALPLLIGGQRAAPPRQQTLRATLDWSHNLLSTEEQAVFRRVAVFGGGWTLEAAEAICSDNPSADVETTVADLLGRLVDKSLVVREEVAGAARFRLLEPIRQYAVERLSKHGELESLRLRHLEWYAAFAQRSSPFQTDPLAPLVQELDNVRAALRWSLDAGEVQHGLRIGAAIWPFWQGRGYYTEGIQWQSSLLARRTAGQATADHVFALIGAGCLATYVGQYSDAQAWLEESLPLAEQLGLPKALRAAHFYLGQLAQYRGDVAVARAGYERSLATNWLKTLEVIKLLRLGKIQSSADHDAFEAVRTAVIPLLALARLDLVEGDAAQASARGHEARRLAQMTGDKWGIAHSLQVLGRAAHDQGHLRKAHAILAESLNLYREVVYPQGISFGLTELATLALDRGDRQGARDHLVEALTVAEEAGEFLQIARVLEELGVLAASSEATRAATLAGAAFAFRESIQAPTRDPRLSPADHARRERWLHVACATLGEPTFIRAWEEGTKLSLDMAIDRAVSVVPPERAAMAADHLTPRERQVAALVAQGQTNQQIADQLVFTEATARKHLEHILDKLGFNSRAQIVAWHVGARQAAFDTD
jgi:predicted ATPase/DNA-binding CsgD family transcriptional regulator